jgi:hypothetical protein
MAQPISWPPTIKMTSSAVPGVLGDAAKPASVEAALVASPTNATGLYLQGEPGKAPPQSYSDANADELAGTKQAGWGPVIDESTASSVAANPSTNQMGPVLKSSQNRVPHVGEVVPGTQDYVYASGATPSPGTTVTTPPFTGQ